MPTRDGGAAVDRIGLCPSAQALRGRQDAGGVAAGGGVAGTVQHCRAGPCGAIDCCVERWDLARATPSIGYTA
ncbi:MAG: hypothetical protein K0U78_03090 [Actinomycetia bacterium]|nr:hypothetical protein [Actinomycetes bacterium]